MFIVNGKCLRWLFHYTQNFHITNITRTYFFFSLRVCVLFRYFLPFFIFTCYFLVHSDFEKKNNISLLCFCWIASVVTAPITSYCCEFCSLRSVCRLAGWLTVFLFLYLCLYMCMCFFYLFIEFNSFTVGC